MKRIPQSVYKPLIERYLKVILDFARNQIGGVVLFGSVARGQAKENSDIDMLILLKKKNKKLINKILKINIDSYDWEENQRLLEKKIYTKIFDIKKTEEELRENPLILLDILDYGIILYDPYKRMRRLLSDLRKKLKELKAEKIVFEDGKWCWDLKPNGKPGEILEIKL